MPQELNERQIEEMALSSEVMPANKQPMQEQDEEMLAEENQRPQGLLDRQQASERAQKAPKSAMWVRP